MHLSELCRRIDSIAIVGEGIQRHTCVFLCPLQQVGSKNRINSSFD